MLLNETLFTRYGGWLPENPVIYESVFKELCCDVNQSVCRLKPHALAVAGFGKTEGPGEDSNLERGLSSFALAKGLVRGLNRCPNCSKLTVHYYPILDC
jgi:hypothetical protein